MQIKVWVPLCILALAAQTSLATAQVDFPLRLSQNGRYLEDSAGRPFLIREISAWGLIQALSEEDESAFMDSVKEKGFNTLLVSIISYDTRFAGNPPDCQGQPPFRVKWDFSTVNPAYFAHVDRFLGMAEQKGFLVLLVPCYLGYRGDPKQGWWDELLSPQNSPLKSRRYGEFLGTRYKDFPNIVWVAGGDNDGGGIWYDHMNNIILGIKEYDRDHLWTGHFDSSPGTNWSTGNPLYAKYINLDGLYDFIEANLGSQAPQYYAELVQYEKGKMIFQLDQSYENDIPHGPDNTDHQWIRRKNYDGLLSGCAGTSFSPGEPDDPCYTFLNWRPLMNTEGMEETYWCFRAFLSRPWYELVPDQGDQFLKSGRGNPGGIDYVCAAIAPDSSLYMAYLPNARTLTLDLGKLSGLKKDAWWYNPRNGNAIPIRIHSSGDLEIFNPPSAGDWLLVVDNAALGLPAPGIETD